MHFLAHQQVLQEQDAEKREKHIARRANKNQTLQCKNIHNIHEANYIYNIYKSITYNCSIITLKESDDTDGKRRKGQESEEKSAEISREDA